MGKELHFISNVKLQPLRGTQQKTFLYTAKNPDESQVLCCLIHHRIMRPFQNKSSWRSSWCSLKRTSWLGLRWHSTLSHVFSVICWSSSAHLRNFAPEYQLIQCFSWFENYSWHILSCQKEFASWGKSNQEARYQREVPSLPLQGAKPLIPIDVQRTTTGQKEIWKARKRTVKIQTFNQAKCAASVKIRFWLSKPLLHGGEHLEQDRVCGIDKPHQLTAATGNSGFRKVQYNNKKNLKTQVFTCQQNLSHFCPVP